MTLARLVPYLVIAVITGFLAYGCWAVTVSAAHLTHNCVVFANCVVD